MDPKHPNRARVRRLAFAAGALLFVYLLLELFSLAAYGLRFGALFSFADIAARKSRRLVIDTAPAAGDGQPSQGVWGERLPHPYLGYVLRKMPLDMPAACQPNEHGFLGAADLGGGGDGETVQVMITGGSVAHMFLCDAHQALARELATVPRFAGKTVKLFGFSVTGYKQPQQLYGLLYYLLLGGRLDLVINIDGFNEVHTAVDLHRRKAHPLYPISWDFLVSRLDMQRVFWPLYRVVRFNEARARAAALHRRARFSVTAGLLWRLYDEHTAGQVAALRAGMVKARQKLDIHDLRQPAPPYAGGDVVAYAARVWRDAVRAMADTCAARKIPFFSFLQPNQYLPGSKTLTAEEQQAGVAADPVFRRSVTEGYPLLRQRGAELAAGGVSFGDLTGLFKEEKGTLYIDRCCHFNRRGNQLMARAIGAAVRRKLGGRDPGETP